MAKLDQLIAQTKEWKDFYKHRRDHADTKGARHAASIEALACSIRLNALQEAKKAILDERGR